MATINSNKILMKNYFFAQWLYHYTPEQLELIRNSNLIPRLQSLRYDNPDKDKDVILDLLNLLYGTNHTSIYKRYDTFEDCFNNDFEFNFDRLDILFAYSILLSNSFNFTYDNYCPNKTTIIYRTFHMFMNARNCPRVLFSYLFDDIVFARSEPAFPKVDYIVFKGGGFIMARDYGTEVAGKAMWDFTMSSGRSI